MMIRDGFGRLALITDGKKDLRNVLPPPLPPRNGIT